ncbi:hypothetical protein [Filimonas effusa]|uniref:Uncharacterized protein n=1 Tax=Filimonas effusa TaxID=2508721 RepID=A0A4V1M9M8_9BACT|nr:hypothetical protein [Filimonas effusa]RXK81760.1 hypothetical protein ESB13_18380 [Filimonas effusa]
MKSLRVVLAAVLAVAVIGAAFAFAPAKKVKNLAPIQYEYIGAQPATPTSATTPGNWTTPTTLPDASNSGTQLYGIRFDTDDTNLSEALDIVSDNLNNLSNGQEYQQDGHAVTVFLKVAE